MCVSGTTFSKIVNAATTVGFSSLAGTVLKGSIGADGGAVYGMAYFTIENVIDPLLKDLIGPSEDATYKAQLLNKIIRFTGGFFATTTATWGFVNTTLYSISYVDSLSLAGTALGFTVATETAIGVAAGIACCTAAVSACHKLTSHSRSRDITPAEPEKNEITWARTVKNYTRKFFSQDNPHETEVTG